MSKVNHGFRGMGGVSSAGGGVGSDPDLQLEPSP